MSIGMTLWLAIAVGLAAFWLVRLIFIVAAERRRLVLHARSYAPPYGPLYQGGRAAARVSVVVAAKDEERNIEACVTSLLKQDYCDFEVIVVDDRSRDRTPLLLEQLRRGAGDRLRVVHVCELPAGWTGKNHAMHEGVSVSTGEWLLFTDADCRQLSRRTITIGVAEAEAHDVDFLSVTPVLDTPHVWDRIVQPVCALMLILWFLPEKVNDPHKKAAYANGAFMLMRRSCYDEIGGHERVKDAVNEDIQMARLAKRAGLRLRVVENDDLYRTRMYDTPRAAWHGWSRIFFGCLRTMRRLLLSAGLLILTSIVPWVCLAVAVVGCFLADRRDAGPWMTAVGAWLLVVVLSQAAKWRLYRILRVPPIWSLAYSLGACVTLGVMGSAMLKVLGATGATWRGTTYHRLPVRHTGRWRP